MHNNTVLILKNASTQISGLRKGLVRAFGLEKIEDVLLLRKMRGNYRNPAPTVLVFGDCSKTI